MWPHAPCPSINLGGLLLIFLFVAASLAVHAQAVGGVAWLGASARLVSFSSEKAEGGGFKNVLLITGALPLREGWGGCPAGASSRAVPAPALPACLAALCWAGRSFVDALPRSLLHAQMCATG